ncbi:MAG: hypothetical protein QXI39_07905 [Candidatus Bathyarchaeia archaeon]
MSAEAAYLLSFFALSYNLRTRSEPIIGQKLLWESIISYGFR